jgi:hypothetical protein
MEDSKRILYQADLSFYDIITIQVYDLWLHVSFRFLTARHDFALQLLSSKSIKTIQQTAHKCRLKFICGILSSPC